MIKPDAKKLKKSVEGVFGSYWKGLTPDEKRTILNNVECIMFYGNMESTQENMELVANAMRNCFFIGMRY